MINLAKSESQGLCTTSERLYGVWLAMKQRCRNPYHVQFSDYGGRGIRVCDEWLDYLTFREWAYSHGYDKDAKTGKCTIDRIDVNGNYEPSNCRWVDMKVQVNNRRPRNEWNTNKYISWLRRNDDLKRVCKLRGMKLSTVLYRINSGTPPMEAVLLYPGYYAISEYTHSYQNASKGTSIDVGRRIYRLTKRERNI